MKNYFKLFSFFSKKTLKTKNKKNNITNNDLKFGLYLFNESNNFNVVVTYKDTIINMGPTMKFSPRKYKKIAKLLKEIHGDSVDVFPELVINDKITTKI